MRPSKNGICIRRLPFPGMPKSPSITIPLETTTESGGRDRLENGSVIHKKAESFPYLLQVQIGRFDQHARVSLFRPFQNLPRGSAFDHNAVFHHQNGVAQGAYHAGDFGKAERGLHAHFDRQRIFTPDNPKKEDALRNEFPARKRKNHWKQCINQPF